MISNILSKSNKKNLAAFSPAFLFLAGTMLFASCVNTKKSFYFNNIDNGSVPEDDIEAVIQKNDLLSISVSSLNPEATVIFNTPNYNIPNQSGNGSSLQTVGYLVNREGNIFFPILGNIMAAGLTQKKLTDTLAYILMEKQLLVDPIVNVRVINFKVTVLGEVSKPTVVSVPNEKISMLEAIGMAGDMTLYAKRDDVLLIRVENGKKLTRRINMNSPEFITSPYYYLKTNDVIYVEPNDVRVASGTRLHQVLPVVLSGLSFFAIIIDRIFFRK